MFEGKEGFERGERSGRPSSDRVKEKGKEKGKEWKSGCVVQETCCETCDVLLCFLDTDSDLISAKWVIHCVVVRDECNRLAVGGWRMALLRCSIDCAGEGLSGVQSWNLDLALALLPCNAGLPYGGLHKHLHLPVCS